MNRNNLLMIWTLLLSFSISTWGQENNIVSIQIVPEKVTLEPGQQQSFTAFGYDENDDEVSFQNEWRATGGTITSDGVFTAGNGLGIYSVTAVASDTGAEGSSIVKIIYAETKTKEKKTRGVIERLELSPSPVELNPGQRVRFQVRALDGQEMEMKASKLIWRVTGGSITEKGVYQAGGAPGSYLVRVKVPNGVSTTAMINIVGEVGTVSRIKIIPDYSSVKPDEKKRFFAIGYNSAGNVIKFTPKWEATGGEISKHGVYVGGARSGNYFVKASSPNGVSSTSTINIQEMTLGKLELFPDGAVLFPGQVQKFSAKIYDIRGREVDVFPLWSATGGIIQADGTYLAGMIPGRYQINVTAGTHSVEASIVIKELGNPAKVKIFPEKIMVKSQEVIQVKAIVYDKDDKVIDYPVRWKVSGGIYQDHYYTAGNAPGEYEVSCTAGKTVQAKAVVIIKGSKTSTAVSNEAPKPKETVKQKDKPYLRVAGHKSKIKPEQKYFFNVELIVPPESNKKMTLGQLKWETSGGSISPQGLFTAGKKEGRYVLILKDMDNRIGKRVIVYIYEGEVPPEILKADTKDKQDSKPKERKDSEVVFHEWKIKSYQKGIGTISVKGEIHKEGAVSLHLLSKDASGQSKELYKLNVSKGQTFRFNAPYIKATKVGIILLNAAGDTLFEKFEVVE